jgi:hypothetical protein
MAKKYVLGLLAAIVLAGPAMINADTLSLGPALGPAPDGPPRGITMVEVEQLLGPPHAKSEPVGEPPITKWQYPKFNVYFEFDKVLHSVEQR